MTKSELIKKVASWSFEITPAQVEQLVGIILNEITQAVKSGQRVELRNFGTFVPRHRAARTGRNPRTGTSVPVPAKEVMFFNTGKALKERLNGKKAERHWTDER